MQRIDVNKLLDINLDSNILNLDKTLDCGQCFRWEKQSIYWVGVVKDKAYIFTFNNVNNDSIIKTSATQEEWDNEVKDYFDLNTDYSVINIPISDKFANEAAKFGSGIRILKQDPWETLISFIISQRNNIPKIKSTISKLCERYGERKELDILYETGSEYRKYFYTFPKAADLAKLTTSDLDGIGLGYRDEYILNAARKIDSGELDLLQLKDKNISGEYAVDKLQSLYGVGPKVANCVALFGLHKLDMFPIDIWITRIIDQYYNGNIDITAYGKLAGLVQQYMFFYIKSINN